MSLPVARSSGFGFVLAPIRMLTAFAAWVEPSGLTPK